MFLLTDGCVSSPDRVIQSISQHCKNDDTTKVFTFGISDYCDKRLVTESAKGGNGTCTLVGNEEMSMLKEKVVDALRKAGVPSMQGCTFDFGTGLKKELGSLYQNELVRVFALMPEEKFEKMKCTFYVKFNPETKDSQTEDIDPSKFKEIECHDHTYLFKLAAKDAIEHSQDKVPQKEMQDLSVKYQVLSKHTQMVGVKKNSKKAAAVVEDYPMEKAIRMNTVSNQVMSQQMQYQVKSMRKQGVSKKSAMNQLNN